MYSFIGQDLAGVGIALLFLLVPLAPWGAAGPGAVLAAGGQHGLPVGDVWSQISDEDESTPTLRCTAAAVPVQDPSVSLTVVTCTVTNAALEETSFRLRATFQEPGGDGWTLDPFCISQLIDERGLCGQTLSHPADAAGGRLTLSGTLRPSGRELPRSTVTFPARR